MNKISFTTSWDDGSVLDLKIADLLSHYRMKGTFYVPQKFDGSSGKYSAYNRRLNDGEIHSIALHHEIGGHSLTHRPLIDLSLDEARKELLGSRQFLEEITQTPIKMFAFPRGKYNEQIIALTKEAGYIGGRTTKKLAINISSNPFLMEATTICQPFPFRKIDSRHYYWRRLFDPMHAYSPMQWSLSWLALAKTLFRKSLASGNYFHLYGHSWEIEKYGMWDELEEFLRYVRAVPDIVFVTNSEIVSR